MIKAALRPFALRKRAAEIMAGFASAGRDFAGPAEVWRSGGGRDLSGLEEAAREGDEACITTC